MCPAPFPSSCLSLGWVGMVEKRPGGHPHQLLRSCVWAAGGLGLGVLHQPQEGLCDAQEVDHLCDAKERGDDQGTAVGALQEGGWTLMPPDLPAERAGSGWQCQLGSPTTRPLGGALPTATSHLWSPTHHHRQLCPLQGRMCQPGSPALPTTGQEAPFHPHQEETTNHRAPHI